MTDESPTDGGHDDGSALPVGRRELLGVGVGTMVGVGASVVAQDAATADPQGALGASTDPLQAAYLNELRGPITETGTPITQLVNIRIAVAGANVTADPGTLIVRRLVTTPASVDPPNEVTFPPCSGVDPPSSTQATLPSCSGVGVPSNVDNTVTVGGTTLDRQLYEAWDPCDTDEFTLDRQLYEAWDPCSTPEFAVPLQLYEDWQGEAV